MDEIITKKCGKCKETKSQSCFSKDKHTKSGLQGWCKKCRDLSHKEWRDSYPEKIHKWYYENLERAKELERRWRSLNPDKVREKSRNRRALKVSTGTVTTEEWKGVLEKYGNKCLFPNCDRKDLEMDHVIPISIGGTNTVDNIQPLCKSHNSRKKDKYIDYR